MNADQRINELEMKLMFQENTIDSLNEVVTYQQKKINTLTEEIDLLKILVERIGSQASGGMEIVDTRPPHY